MIMVIGYNIQLSLVNKKTLWKAWKGEPEKSQEMNVFFYHNNKGIIKMNQIYNYQYSYQSNHNVSMTIWINSQSIYTFIKSLIC